MTRQRAFLTGATGGMGLAGLHELLKDSAHQDLVILVRPSEKNRALLAPYEGRAGLEIRWGDLNSYDDVYACVERADIVLHVGAMVSPEADYRPERGMAVNYGSTMNLLEAIREQGRQDEVRFVYIGTIAQTGDRMPPIHWGRIGDPLKPSVFDYYALSKVASERAVIDSGLRHWVSLRQTGILSEKMTQITDAIMLHNCLDNVLEYVSDRDSGVLLRNVCRPLPESFWGHVYNIGGGSSCRTSTYEMYVKLFGAMGIADLSAALDPRMFAIRNFHGHYYLDSDVLEDHLHFRSDSMQYFYDAYLRNLGSSATISRLVSRLPGGQRVIGSTIKNRFAKTARTEHGTLHFIEDDVQDAIQAYFISRERWEAIPPMREWRPFTDWDTVVPISRGYDEDKPEDDLTTSDLRDAAAFRGGRCEGVMDRGDWTTRQPWTCAFGHAFQASPRLVLEGGHWCPTCERESWNYHEIAKVNPFFAQVWYPLHDKAEPGRIYPKKINELQVRWGRA